MVSAVGHEVDVTVADLVADQRAPTPSAAAELLSPDKQELLSQLTDWNRKLTQGIESRLQWHRQQLEHLQLRLRHPGALLREQQQKLDETTIRLRAAMDRCLGAWQQQLEHRMDQLEAYSPLATLRRGYAIVRTADGQTLTDSRRLQPGDKVQTRLAKGSFWSVVTSTQEQPRPPE